GKPTWFGKLGGARVIGLPGNPASAIVTAALFAQPLIRKLAGLAVNSAIAFDTAQLTAPLKANGKRECYLRGMAAASSGGPLVTPAANQDSALLSPFANANVLIRRPVDAPAAGEGETVEIVWLR
ncbi:MAG: hypothetical protein ACX939_09745, partial [Hyphococcus sp.]